MLATIRPDWPAPATVVARVTTRGGGVSRGSYASLNLGDHVGDATEAVAANRARLAEGLTLPGEPRWLRQVHGTRVVELDSERAPPPTADAALTRTPGVVCAVLTADCLPVLLTDRAGTVVAIAHAGWRGLAAGVIEATVAATRAEPGELIAWLGPAISQGAYEVGDEVRAACLGEDPAARHAFAPSPSGRWLADLYALARGRLARLGVDDVTGGEHCTHGETERFFSHRRAAPCGRFASLIWLVPRDPGPRAS